MNAAHRILPFCAPAWLLVAVALLLAIALAPPPAYAQPALTLPTGPLPPCPSAGPCVTVTPTLYPAYFNVTFQNLPDGLSITNNTYLGWCADLFGHFTASETYLLYSSYSLLPVTLMSNWHQVNWLLNHKPTSIVDDFGNTVTDPRTLRDVIQQVIWELLDGGPTSHYCCTVDFIDPLSENYYKTQYNGSIGANGLSSGRSIVNAIDNLYSQAIVQTGFVPLPGQVIAVVMKSDGYLDTSDNNVSQDNLLELVIPPIGNFTAFTQGGWGAPPHGSNPGAILAANFSSVYGASGVTIGRLPAFYLKFTSAAAIEAFLPQGGTPGQLNASATNPTARTAAGVFAGQVLALKLNVDFSAAGILPNGLGALVLPSGQLAGYTVSQVLALANSVLGGGALPPGMTVSQLNDIVDSINNLNN